MASSPFDPTDDQIRKLVEQLAAVPPTPQGPHVTDDEADAYAAGALSPAREQEIDTHLASCADCTLRLATLFEHAQERLRPSAETRLDALEQRLRRSWTRAQAAFPDESIDERVVSWVKRLASELVPPPRMVPSFRTLGPRPPTWTTSRGIDGNLDARGDTFVFTLSSSDQSLLQRLVWYSIDDAESGEAWTTGWLLLHRDGANVSGATRLTPGLAQPPPASVLRIEVCELDPSEPPDLDALGDAYAAAATDSDRAAWRGWVELEIAAGRLPSDARDAILGRR
jgi:hypothetical protein